MNAPPTQAKKPANLWDEKPSDFKGPATITSNIGGGISGPNSSNLGAPTAAAQLNKPQDANKFDFLVSNSLLRTYSLFRITFQLLEEQVERSRLLRPPIMQEMTT